MFEEKTLPTIKARKRGILLILFIGISLFVWELGSTGLFDETPPLFAAAARSMHLTGDWLTPRVNGLPRFDKPPLVYWLMGLIYAMPGQETWDPLGTWSARLPSAIASLLMMLCLGETLMNFPQGNDQFPRRTAFITSLAFALSPLVIIWSRIAVSDALLCGTLGISLLYQWRRYADPSRTPWWFSWVVLGLAVLTKGPVSIVITLMVLFLFSLIQKDYKRLINLIKPFNGLLITSLISFPWYLIELVIEGKPFFKSFFGYHNFQRLTSVVNSHQEPWWFFGMILLIASLPYTPFLLVGLFQEIKNLLNVNSKTICLPEDSLNKFAFSWLLSILILFTCAATKLPSYWLPATPAAAIMISLSPLINYSRKLVKISFIFTFFIILAFSGMLLFLPLWAFYINDPEMPTLAIQLIESQIHLQSFILILISTFIAVPFFIKLKKGKLISFQIPSILFQLFIILPIFDLGDQLRQLPLRKASDLIIESQKEDEPIAMVGINKPSIHFYTKKIVFYEANDDISLTNLAERLSNEKRNNWEPQPINIKESSKTFILLIDKFTSKYSHWMNLNPEVLGEFGIYKVWRLKRYNLERRSNYLKSEGVIPNWQVPRPERL